MNGRRIAATTALATCAGLAAWTGTAAAAPPEGAGPPVVEEFDLVGDPVSLLCGDRLLEFTEGTLLSRTKVLPSGEIRETRRPIGGVLEDQSGTVYRIRGVATFKANLADGDAVFRLTGAVVGPAGMTETVNSTFRYENEMPLPPIEHGTCTVLVE